MGTIYVFSEAWDDYQALSLWCRENYESLPWIKAIPSEEEAREIFQPYAEVFAYAGASCDGEHLEVTFNGPEGLRAGRFFVRRDLDTKIIKVGYMQY